MDLGKFSISLAVKDLAASRDFYRKLGFEVRPGKDFEDQGQVSVYDQDWVILEQDGVMLGLFQGMFDKNTLTFNPPDVRAVQKDLKSGGVELVMEVDENTTGPAAALLLDPDGNPVLLEQHDPCCS